MARTTEKNNRGRNGINQALYHGLRSFAKPAQNKRGYQSELLLQIRQLRVLKFAVPHFQQAGHGHCRNIGASKSCKNRAGMMSDDGRATSLCR